METQKNSVKKVSIIGTIILILVIAVFAVIYMTQREKPTEGTKNITVKVVLNDGSSQEFKYKTDEEFLSGVLLKEKLIEGTAGPYGLYIDKVNGVQASQEKQEWWCVTKGGEQVNTGVDATPIHDGDTFELTLTVGW